MNDITQPLRLAVGSHRAGSGKGCAMNVVSWINGDTTITDMPDCADPYLARIVQYANDKMCTHRDSDLLCPDCSTKALELGIRTIGTAGLATKETYVRLAVFSARKVVHLNPDPRVEAAIQAAERWLETANAATAANAASATSTAANAANAASYGAAASASASSSSSPPFLASYAAVNAASYAAAATSTAANAAYAAYATSAVDFAVDLMDEFDRLVGRTKTTIVADSAITAAIENMVAT